MIAALLAASLVGSRYGPDKGTPSGIRYEQLAGSVLVNGEQALQHEIDELKAEVLSLQARLSANAN
jgi:hypothetical protein